MPQPLPYCLYVLFSEKDARKREMYLKTTAGSSAIKLMLNATLYTLGYAEKMAFIFTDENEE